jgi:hypothetical protein
MPLTVPCDCGKLLQVKDSLAGKRIRCPGCQAVLTVPAADEEPTEEPEPVAPARAARPPKPAARPQPEADEEDEAERPRGKGQDWKAKPKTSSANLLVLLGLGGAIVVLVGAAVAVLVIMNLPLDTKKPEPQAARSSAEKKEENAGSKKQEAATRDRTPTVVVLTGEQLAKEYLKDRTGALNKYRGKVLEITGVMDAAPGGDPAKETVLTLRGHPDPKGRNAIILCSLPPADRDRFKEVTVGQSVKVRGRLEDSAVFPFPNLIDGQVVDVGKPLPTAASLTAVQLMKEYHGDRPAAAQKYNGQRLEVSGTVAQVQCSLFGGARVLLEGYTTDSIKDIGELICEFPTAEEDRCTALSKGQAVKVQGRFDGQGGLAMFRECRLAEVGKDPAIVRTAATLTREFAADRDAAARKYHDQPLLLEGVVVEVQRKDGVFILLLAGHDETAANPLRVRVRSPGLLSKRVEAQFAAVKKGQVHRVRGVGAVNAFEDSLHLNAAFLQKD